MDPLKQLQNEIHNALNDVDTSGAFPLQRVAASLAKKAASDGPDSVQAADLIFRILTAKVALVIIFALVLVMPFAAHAQNLATVSGSNVQDLNGAKLANGQICFQATDNMDQNISFQAGGGGQVLKRKFCNSVTAGVITSFTVPNPANTLPSGIYYRVTVLDTSTGQEVLRYTGVTFSGTSFNFDTYTPVIPGSSMAPLSGSTVSGNLGVTGNVAATGTITGSNIPANILQQVFNQGTGLTQRTALNCLAGLLCSDNAGTSKTDMRVGGLTTVTFSATPTFDASTANSFKITLTGNVTSSTLSNATAGEPISIEVCQDATGGRTFVPPANVSGWVTIPSGANVCIRQDLVYDGTNAVAGSAGTVELASPPPIGSTTPNTGAFTTLNGTTVTSSTTNTGKRFITAGGTALVSGDFTFTGWGTTASIGSIGGTDGAVTFLMTANGTGQTANPNVVLHFHDGAWTNTPVCIISGLQGNAAVVTWEVQAPTTTTVQLTLVNPPTPSAGSSYGANVICQGR